MTMTAYRTGSSGDSYYLTDWNCDYYFPKVQCSGCGKEHWDTFGWYPCLSTRRKANASRFNDELTVDVEEFKRLITEVKGFRNSGTKIMPAAGFGRVRAKLPKKRVDFLWCEMKPLIKTSALETLAKNGIHLKGALAFSNTTNAESDYFAIQASPVPLYSDKTLEELTFKQCSVCTFWYLENYRVKLNGPREYILKRFPEGEHLVRSEEGGETIASPTFVEVVRENKITGIEFDPMGSFV
jgi:hypothetical protein